MKKQKSDPTVFRQTNLKNKKGLTLFEQCEFDNLDFCKSFYFWHWNIALLMEIPICCCNITLACLWKPIAICFGISANYIPFLLHLFIFVVGVTNALTQEVFEVTNGATIIRISKKNRQHNGQKKSTKGQTMIYKLKIE